MAEFYERFKLLKEAKNCTYTDIAVYLNLKPRMVKNFATPDYLPSTKHLIALADFFNVSTDYLLGRSDK